VQVSAPPSVASSKPRILGKVAQDALKELGSNLPDSPLKTALRRLLRRS
jgi:hypothetical protein